MCLSNDSVPRGLNLCGHDTESQQCRVMLSSTQTSSLSAYLSVSSQNEAYYTWMNGFCIVILGKDVFNGSDYPSDNL